MRFENFKFRSFEDSRRLVLSSPDQVLSMGDPSYDPEKTASMNLRVFTRMRLTGGCRLPVDGGGNGNYRPVDGYVQEGHY